MSEIEVALPEYCSACSAITYPNQGFCRICLSEEVAPSELPATGTLLAKSTLHHSFEQNVIAHLPLNLCAVELAGGPVVFVLSRTQEGKVGSSVSIDMDRWPFGDRLTVVQE